MAQFEDKSRKTLQNKIFDGGIADNQNQILLPRNTSGALSDIVTSPGSIAYDTDLGAVVVNTGSGFVPVADNSPNVPANTVYAGPDSGPSAAPSFRALTTDDVPSINELVPDQSTHSGEFLTTDGLEVSWAPASGGGITNPLTNSTYLKWRNFANNTDLNVLTVDAADAITLGQNSGAFPAFVHIYTGNVNGGSMEMQTDAITLYGNADNAVQMQWYAADQSNTAAIKAPETLADSYILTLPSDDGDSGQFLQTDGTGILSWAGAADLSLSNLSNPTSINQDFIFNTNADAFIKTLDTTGDSAIPFSMNVSAGSAAGADTAGGTVNIISGASTGTSSDIPEAPSGTINISSNTSTHGKTGSINIYSGDSSVDRRTGTVTIRSGDRTGAGGFNSGEAFFLTGDAYAGGSGFIFIRTGAGGGGGAGSGDAFLATGSTESALTGSIGIKTGDTNQVATTADTGSVSITTGSPATGTGLSGAMTLATGVAAGLNTGAVNISTGTNQGLGDSANSGNLQVFTGNVDATGASNQSGFLNIFTGNAPGIDTQSSGGVSIATGSSGYQSGEVLIRSGDGTEDDTGFSGGVTLATGSVTGTADSGNIVLSTGTVATGSRGFISMSGLFARMPVGTTDPSGATGGELYFNTGTSKLRLFDGSTWVDLN